MASSPSPCSGAGTERRAGLPQRATQPPPAPLAYSAPAGCARAQGMLLNRCPGLPCWRDDGLDPPSIHLCLPLSKCCPCRSLLEKAPLGTVAGVLHPSVFNSLTISPWVRSTRAFQSLPPLEDTTSKHLIIGQFSQGGWRIAASQIVCWPLPHISCWCCAL